MEHNELKFSGINRRVSDYSNGGACEELINLRPLETGLEVVKSKAALFGASLYDDLYVHHTSYGDRYIGITRSQYGITYTGLSDVGAPAYSLVVTASLDSAIAALGDLLIISDKGDAQTLVYKATSTNYSAMDATIPNVSVSVQMTNYPVSVSDIDDLVTVSTDVTDFLSTDGADPSEDEEKQKAMLNAMLEYVRGKDKMKCYGMTILAFNYTLTTGEEFWTFKYVPVDPLTDLADNYSYSGASWSSGSFPFLFFRNVGTQPHAYMCVPSSEIGVTITRSGTYDADKSLLKSINIYSTIPTAPISIELDGGMIIGTPNHSEYTAYVANALFYKQFSIDLSEMGASAYRTLVFGSSSAIAARDVLDVDAGPVKRFGEMLSYNNRLHYYDSIARCVAYPPEFNPDGTLTSQTMALSYKTNEGASWAEVTGNAPSSSTNRYLVCCPDARIDRIKVNGYLYPMIASNKYNFSFNVTRNMQSLTGTVPSSLTGYIDIPEERTVNVTGQMSPLEFPVENSYAIGGKVNALVVNADNLTESQTGQWPVYAYTDRGVFALEQGSGEVLYARVTPVSMLVAESNAASSPYGHFFLSGGHLYNLRGKHAVIVSDALEAEPHKEIRSSAQYQTMYNGSLYNISGLESKVDFRTFCKGASVTYDPFADEIIVSNATQTYSQYDYLYSYVLDLRRKQWHKIDSTAFPSGNTSTISRMYTTSTLGTRAVGRIDVKDSVLFEFTETIYGNKLFTSNTVACPVSTFTAGTTLTARCFGRVFSSWTATEITPAKIALAKLFVIKYDSITNETFVDIEKLGGSNYRLLAGRRGAGGSAPDTWSIFSGDTEIMTFTFDGSYITGGFQNKTTGKTIRVFIGQRIVEFVAGNSDTSQYGESAVLLAEQIVSAVNADTGGPATASRSGTSVILVAKGEGPTYNGSVSVTPLYSDDTDSFINVACTNMMGGSSAGTNEYFCNLAAEEETPIRRVHLESRPVSFGYAFSHILRTVLLIKARLQALSGVVAISVFGSDDLFSWTCISTGQKKSAMEGLLINRIRNNRAAKSWRYYKVCIGGHVPTDADIGPIIVDWNAINRRIG